MAWKGIVSNGNAYYPYLAAGIFAVFTYFVFASILHNDIIRILPKSAYAWIMLRLGKSLLSLILFLFLIYANSFLVKRRRREFGLYNILGLEKKHIGSMMFFETVLLYMGALGGGIILGMVLSKLMFLILLRICRLSADIPFVFEPEAFKETLIYFGCVFALNFAGGLWQVGKARPVELMSGSRKGEREPRFLWLGALLGVAAMGGGYYCSITSKLDSMIFINFILAVSLVIVGTYLLFTSGSIVFLKWMRMKRKIYYKPENFITISGMIYRMKKNAASLSNICIFSTMVIITLICTISLCIGMEDATHFDFPYDATLCYCEEKIAIQEVMEEIGTLEETYGIKAERVDISDRPQLYVGKSAEHFGVRREENLNSDNYEEECNIIILTQDDYNRIEKRSVSLSEDEAVVYCSAEDYGYDTIDFFDMKFAVCEEIDSFFPNPKEKMRSFNVIYLMVVKDQQVQQACIRAWGVANGVEDMETFIAVQPQYVQVLLAGKDEEKSGFIDALEEWGQSRPGFTSFDRNVEERSNREIMYGALMFLGVLFGLIFFMCLILIMYYKQISEGYEDRDNFGIMQKVGMSDQEIHSTVHRQILMVFGLPLVGAVLHTLAGMFMVRWLMTVVSLFDENLFAWCTAGVVAVFGAVYGVSYLVTAKTYYRIVRH